MDKLPFTALVCNCPKDDESLLIPVLAGLWFCDQKIFVSDRSTEKSKDIAKRFGFEIWEWLGSDNMSERRNYGVGWDGDENHTPEWITHEVMKKHHPVVRNDYIIQADSDEFYDITDTYGILKVFVKDKEREKYDNYAVRLTNINPRTNHQQSAIPLERIFKKGVHWENAVHNCPIVKTQGHFWPISLAHYGYSEDDHFKKQWKRIGGIEQKVRENPDDIQQRAYLVNSLHSIGGKSPIMFDRIFAHVDIFCEMYRKAKKDEVWKYMLQKIMRSFWHACGDQMRFGKFIELCSEFYDDIKWHPDVPYFMYIANLQQERLGNAVMYGEEFINTLRDFVSKDIKLPVEVLMLEKEREVTEVIVDILKNIKYQSSKLEKKRLKRLARWTAELEK